MGAPFCSIAYPWMQKYQILVPCLPSKEYPCSDSLSMFDRLRPSSTESTSRAAQYFPHLWDSAEFSLNQANLSLKNARKASPRADSHHLGSHLTIIVSLLVKEERGFHRNRHTTCQEDTEDTWTAQGWDVHRSPCNIT